MTHQRSTSAKTPQTAEPAVHDTVSDSTGAALTPPDYGLESLDSGQLAPEMEAPSSLVIQPKLTVTHAGDRYEQEAEAMSRYVVGQLNAPASLPTPESVQRHVSLIQRSGDAMGGMDVSSDVESRIHAARGSGSPIADEPREKMERAFGADFSGVRVHTDATADMLNRSVQARAFTTGQDIFFGQGEYQPESTEGQGLLAHELTHVRQQNSKNDLSGNSQEVYFLQRVNVNINDKDVDHNTLNLAENEQLVEMMNRNQARPLLDSFLVAFEEAYEKDFDAMKILAKIIVRMQRLEHPNYSELLAKLLTDVRQKYPDILGNKKLKKEVKKHKNELNNIPYRKRLATGEYKNRDSRRFNPPAPVMKKEYFEDKQGEEVEKLALPYFERLLPHSKVKSIQNNSGHGVDVAILVQQEDFGVLEGQFGVKTTASDSQLILSVEVKSGDAKLSNAQKKEDYLPNILGKAVDQWQENIIVGGKATVDYAKELQGLLGQASPPRLIYLLARVESTEFGLVELFVSKIGEQEQRNLPGIPLAQGQLGGTTSLIRGDFGERYVSLMLKKAQYEHIRQIQDEAGHGIDLVAEKGNILYFIEVKTHDQAGKGQEGLSKEERKPLEFVVNQLIKYALLDKDNDMLNVSTLQAVTASQRILNDVLQVDPNNKAAIEASIIKRIKDGTIKFVIYHVNVGKKKVGQEIWGTETYWKPLLGLA